MNDIIPDLFYVLMNSLLSGSWIILAFIYAPAFFLFASMMCWIIGGRDAVINSLPRPIPATKDLLTNPKTIFSLDRNILRCFIEGGRIRWQEMRSDRLSWVWPLLVIFPIVLVYGYGRRWLDNTVNQLVTNGLDLKSYQPIGLQGLNQTIQYVVWVVCLFIVIWTIYRYRHKRTSPTWFSSSLIHHLLQSILFDLIVFYMAAMAMFAWLSYSITLINLLVEDSVKYSILHPDQLYGLSPAYNTIIGMSVILIGLSLMPFLTYIRERDQNYRWVYFALVYGSLGVCVVLLVILIFSFNHRLDIIKSSELKEISLRLDEAHEWYASTDGLHLNQIDAGLEYYQIVSNASGSFPVPTWLSFLVVGRVLFFIYEFVAVTFGVSSESRITKALRRLLIE